MIKNYTKLGIIHFHYLGRSSQSSCGSRQHEIGSVRLLRECLHINCKKITPSWGWGFEWGEENGWEWEPLVRNEDL